MPAPRDLTGQRFGRLVAIRLATADERGKSPGRWWWCECDCGSAKAVAAMWLLSRHPQRQIRSCGCLHEEYLHSPDHLTRLADMASRGGQASAKKTRKNRPER